MSHLKWKAFDAYMTTEEFNNIPDNSTVIAPTLWQHRGIVALTPDYWTAYVKEKCGKSLKIVQNITEPSNRRVYFFSFIQEQKSPNQYMILAPLTESRVCISRQYSFFSLSKYRQLNITGKMVSNLEKPKIIINGKSQASMVIGKDYYNIHLDFAPTPQNEKIIKKEMKNIFNQIKFILARIPASEESISKKPFVRCPYRGKCLF